MTRQGRRGSAAQVVLGLVAVFGLSYLAGRVARAPAPEPTSPLATSPTSTSEDRLPAERSVAVATALPAPAPRDPLDAPALEELPPAPGPPPAASLLAGEIEGLPLRKKGERMRFDAKLIGLGISGPGPADTRRIRRAWEAAPALRAWVAWACDRGEPEALASSQRRDLLDLAASYELRDLPDPLGPFLKLRPVLEGEGAATVPGALAGRAEEVPGFPRRLGPWARVALASLARALLEDQAMAEDVERMSLGKLPREVFPAVEFSLPYALGLTQEKILNRLVRTVQIRRAARKWFAAGTRDLRVALLAVGRSLSEEPDTAWPLALLVASVQSSLRHVWLGSASAWPRRMLLGRADLGRPGALVEAAVEGARGEAQGWMRLRTPAEARELLAQRASALERVLGVPGDGALPRAVRLQALTLRLEVERLRKRPHESVRLLRRFLPELLTSDEVDRVDRVLQVALLGWLELEMPLYPGERELEGLAAWREAHPAGWADEVALELWRRFEAKARPG